MSRPIELTEYESDEVRLDAEQARRLALAAPRVLTVEPAEGPNAYRVTATNFVGTLVVDDLKVLIRPKIKLENLFLMLEVGLRPQAWRQEAYEYALSSNLLPSMAAFYARTLETTLARGLLRSYRPHEEKLVALRGRVDVSARFRQTGIQVPVPCRYDEYTTDIAENRYLKAAVRQCLRLPGVHPEDRGRLLRQMVVLKEVLGHPVPAGALDQIPFTRLNDHYLPALRLARLFLESRSLADRCGDRPASSFLVDMNRLFEEFITLRLGRALRGRLQVKDQYPAHLDTGSKVRIRPDLVFCRQDVPVLVADIKYKRPADDKARASDYYQLLAYATALGLEEGVLIYCDAEGASTESQVTVLRTGKRLHTISIELAGSPDAVAAEIARVAEWILGRARLIPGLKQRVVRPQGLANSGGANVA